MKKILILTTLLLIASLGAIAQAETFNQDDFGVIPFEIGSNPEILITISNEDTIYNFDGIVEFIDSKRDVVTIEDLMEYENECRNDTIVTTTCEYANEYIWEHDGYNEMISSNQLRKLGYEFDHIWVVSADPWKCNAYFVKEPTLKGFIVWMKNKY